MEATFRLDRLSQLRVGNNVVESHSTLNGVGGESFVGIVLLKGNFEDRTTEDTQIACLKPHEAKALASVLLAAATEARA